MSENEMPDGWVSREHSWNKVYALGLEGEIDLRRRADASTRWELGEACHGYLWVLPSSGNGYNAYPFSYGTTLTIQEHAQTIDKWAAALLYWKTGKK